MPQICNLRSSGLAVLIFFLCQVTGESAPLTWEAHEGYRQSKLDVPATGAVGFTLLAPESLGIHWTNRLSIERYSQRQNLMNGAGLALGDFDGDGLCDIYLCNKEGANALYRNLGNWKFENVTERAGVACTNQSSNAAVFADINGDGRLDLLVGSFAGPNACFLNSGDGRFENVTVAASLHSPGGSTSMALADLDGDGSLDLYVNYFGVEAILRDGGSYSTRMVRGKPVVMGRYAKRLAIENNQIVELGEPDMVYRNDGRGHFTSLDWPASFRDENGQPVAAPPDFGLAVQIRDINGDGFPDIYVCNDFQTPDRIWLNNGHGAFQAIPRLALRNMSYASMGVDFADINRDGLLDFITVEMLSRSHALLMNQFSPMNAVPRWTGAIENREEVIRNALYVNRGDGTYAEVAYFAGVAASDWSWTPIFLDVDLDGYEDLLISNGHLHNVNDRDVTATRPTNPAQRPRGPASLLPYPRLDTPNAAFRNRGDLTFADASDAWGFNSKLVSHGMALADLDNDGDLDVVVNAVQSPPLIYRNNSPAPRIAVRLKGKAPNTQGIGGKITVRGGPVIQSQEVICGGRYLSGDDPVRAFAAGASTNRLTIEVRWRNGRQSVVLNAEPNYLYEIDEAGSVDGQWQMAKGTMNSVRGPLSVAAEQSSSSTTNDYALRVTAHVSPMFKDATDELKHSHHEDPFDDFARQPSLTRKFSQLGPGVAWFDLDGDGHDELIIGSGKGGALAVYRRDGKGGLARWNLPNLERPLPDDATGIVGWFSPEGRRSLLVGRSNYETGATNLPSVLRYDFTGGDIQDGPSLPAQLSSAGPLAVADYDGDGDLDLFVGGRMVPGRYPEAASSQLFRNENGKLVSDAENNRSLERIGLVSGAVFSDLDGDGKPELILACEWGPIRILRNRGGRFEPWDARVTQFDSASTDRGPRTTDDGPQTTLHALTGLWNGVTTGDLDGDGRLDIIASNWGRNTFYQRAPTGPWRLLFGDLNGDSRVQLLECYLDPELKKWVPRRDMASLSAALPWLPAQFGSHRAYGQAAVSEILRDRRTQELQAATFASMVFFNRGDHFEAAPLPGEAQWAPAFAVAVGDLDGDGNEDVFLSQNLFCVLTEDSRLDAGRGLWLRGDGKGGLRAVPGQESGVKVYGEQRGAALGDYDEDGRIDLVVTQNGAATRLYRNVGAKPGLRVRLNGPPGNPSGIGACLRLVFGNRTGPLREIHGGSGYWSHDSVVAMLAAPDRPTQIWIRWPGGKVVTANVPEGAKEIAVDAAGSLKVMSR